MYGDQSRRALGAFRQIEIAGQLDAVMIGIGDAVLDGEVAVRHFLASCPEPHAMANGKSRGRTTQRAFEVPATHDAVSRNGFRKNICAKEKGTGNAPTGSERNRIDC